MLRISTDTKWANIGRALLKMIKIGLLGAGRIGSMHAKNLVKHDQYDLKVVYDAHAPAAQAVASKYDGVKVAQTEEQVFADSELDAVLIASVTATHCDFIQRAANAGIAVLCEKPLSLETTIVHQCRANLTPNHAPIQIGFNRRFDPGHHKLRASVKAGLKLEKLIITSRDLEVPSLEYLKNSGGLYKDMMIHDFDMARSILPEEPISIFAIGSSIIEPQICKQIDDIDTAIVVMYTASGILCSIHCSRRAAYGYDQRIEAFGVEGMFISDNIHDTSVKQYTDHATDMSEPLPNFFIERYVEAYRLQLDAFAEVVQSNAEPTPSFEDGYRALVLAELAGQSMREGKPIPVEY